MNELIGRRNEVEEVAALVHSGHRLVTLSGPGGCGKTRLSLAVAAELSAEVADGVWFVSLASVEDPKLVEPTIAQALGIRGRLADELRTRNSLLVLDNFEQVADAGPALAALLAGAPQLYVLVTSRMRLNLTGEREYTVRPLVEEDAVALFRARAADAGVVLEATDVVSAITHALDGLPLALELTAARTKLLPPDEILRRLGRSLDVVAGGARDAPERQRTLRATIEWSHSLLTEAEAAAFARLGVFPGSFDVDAAFEIANLDLEQIGSFVDKSLVARSEARFFLLETIRRFAAEKADEAAGADLLLHRHASYYAGLALRLDPDTRAAGQRAAVAMLRREQPNIRQALATLERADDPLPFARLVGGLAYFWYLNGQFAEGVDTAERALERLAGLDVPEAGRVANTIALLSAVRGETDRAGQLGRIALAIGRRFDDPPTVLRALVSCANELAAQEDWGAFLELIDELRGLADTVGDTWMYALAIVNRGVGHRELGRLHDARADLGRALELVAALGDTDLLIGTLCNAGHVDMRLGDLDAADARFREALTLTRDLPLAETTIWSLDALAAVNAQRGDPERAARLLGAAEGLAASTGYGLPGTREELDRTRQAIEERLGTELADALRAEGAALDAEAAVELGLGPGLD
jgi:predicted ATPase